MRAIVMIIILVFTRITVVIEGQASGSSSEYYL